MTTKPVGRMRLEIEAGSAECPKSATAAIVIQRPNQPIRLGGIVLRESRPGWVSMELPPSESWGSSMPLLTHEQRERIESPGFLEYLRMILGARFMKLTAALRG